MSVYQFLAQLQRAWERDNAQQFLDANNGQALQQAFIALARRDALVQAPEVRELVADLRDVVYVMGSFNLDEDAQSVSKAADLLASLLEAR